MTTINANMNSSVGWAPLTEADAEALEPGFYFIDSENIEVGGPHLDNGYSWGTPNGRWIIRGIAGSLPASHTSGATLTRYYPDAPGAGGPTPTLAEVLAADNDTGGAGIVYDQAGDISTLAAASGTVINIDTTTGAGTVAAHADINAQSLNADASVVSTAQVLVDGNADASRGASVGNDGNANASTTAQVLGAGDVNVILSAAVTGSGNAYVTPIASVGVNGNAILDPTASVGGDGDATLTTNLTVGNDGLANADITLTVGNDGQAQQIVTATVTGDGDAGIVRNATVLGAGTADVSGAASTADGSAYATSSATAGVAGTASAVATATAAGGSASIGPVADATRAEIQVNGLPLYTTAAAGPPGSFASLFYVDSTAVTGGTWLWDFVTGAYVRIAGVF